MLEQLYGIVFAPELGGQSPSQAAGTVAARIAGWASFQNLRPAATTHGH